MYKKDLSYYLSLNYKINLEFEPEEKMWIAYHPEIGRGTCYGSGSSQKEAISALEESKKFVFALAIEEGQTIPEPETADDLPSGQFVVRVPRTIHQKIKDMAERENVSLNQYLVSVISERVGEKSYEYKAEKSALKKRSHHTKQAQKNYKPKAVQKVKAKTSKLRTNYQAGK